MNLASDLLCWLHEQMFVAKPLQAHVAPSSHTLPVKWNILSSDDALTRSDVHLEVAARMLFMLMASLVSRHMPVTKSSLPL